MKFLPKSIPEIINFLLFSLPLAFILGNFIINLIIFFVCVLGIIHYKYKLLDFKKNTPLILIAGFFVVLFLSTLIEVIVSNGNGYLLKSILFLRYLIFLMVIRCLVINAEINFKKILLVCLFFSTFVAIDIIYQYIVGVNFFGFKADYLFSGVFGDEYVAGGYIQRFAVLGCFCIPLLFFKKQKSSYLLLFLILSICFVGTLFTGNRMPTIMFVFFLFLMPIIFSLRKINYKIISFAILIVGMFGIILSTNENLKKRYKNLQSFMPRISVIMKELNREYPEFEKYKDTGKYFYHTEEYKKMDQSIILRLGNHHNTLYITSIDLFTDNPILGRGIKSFRYTCYEKNYLPNRMCENHPHHFYLEILNDTGIIGFGLIALAVLLLFHKNIQKYFIRSNKNISFLDLFFYAIFLSLIIELFPFRSNGSFFSTWNSSFIFLLIGIFSGLSDIKSKQKLNRN